MKNRFYTYIYLNPASRGRYCYNEVCFLYEPLYVGKGQGRRYLQHLEGLDKYRNIETGHFKSKLLNVLRNGFDKFDIKNYILIFRSCLEEQEALALEKQLIAQIGRVDLNKGPLSNLNDGGGGGGCTKKDFSTIQEEFKRRGYTLLTAEKEYVNCLTKLVYICPKGHQYFTCWDNFRQGYGCRVCAGHIVDFATIEDQFRKRNFIPLSKKKDYKTVWTKLKYICPNGHQDTISWASFHRGCGCYLCGRQSAREKQLGEKNHMFGRIFSEEERQHLSQTHQGHFVSEQTKAKIAQAHKGKVLSEKHRKKISETKTAQARKGIIFSEEHRRKLSEAAKRREARRKLLKFSGLKINDLAP